MSSDVVRETEFWTKLLNQILNQILSQTNQAAIIFEAFL